MIGYKFSVILPVYERDDLYILFSKSIKSIFNNTLKPNEVIVIIDGSISLKFNKKILFFQKKYKFKLISSKKKIGLSRALNHAIKKSKYDWIVRADADDINLRNRFKSLFDKINQGYQLVGSNISEHDMDGKLLSYRNVPSSENKIKFFLKFRNPFNHMTVAFSKKLFFKCGGYPHIYLREDYGLWAKMISKKAKVTNINKNLVKATTGQSMINRRSGIKYIIAEFKLRKILNSLKINSFLFGWIICLIRVILLNFPHFLKEKFYQLILRKLY
jgi:glycosyltransferase involved in cell wall biosynthesis